MLYSFQVYSNVIQLYIYFSGGSAGKEFVYNLGDLGLIPGLGRSPGEENRYLLQYSGLEKSTNSIVHGSQRIRHD